LNSTRGISYKIFIFGKLSRKSYSKNYFLEDYAGKLFENLFPAGATEHLGRATQRRNILSDAEISI